MNPYNYSDLKAKRLATVARKASHFVLDMLAANLDNKIVFHNQRHTALTLHAIQLIADHEDLSDEEVYMLQIAAWFQNTGYIRDSRYPLSTSVSFADKFLERNGLNRKNKHQILSCMHRASDPLKVENRLDRSLYDASWYFLAASNFKEMLARMRQEMAFRNEIYSEKDWRNYVARLIYGHQYLTAYGHDILEPEKRSNYLQLYHSHRDGVKVIQLSPR